MMTSYEEHFDLSGLDDEEDLTDDEVFTRSGKSIPVEENGVNKPLMAPRQKGRGSGSDTLQTKIRKVPSLRVVWAQLLYGVIALGSIIGIICLVVFVINTFVTQFGVSLLQTTRRLAIAPCTNVSVKDVWIRGFPMLTTETAIRLCDINQDGIDDAVLGFGTGADAFNYPRIVCDVYFNGAKGCGGGLLALDGRTGQEIWRTYTPHEIFAVNCNVDIDGDHISDCLGAGRMAGFLAVSGRTGHTLWVFDNPQAKINYSNVYTPQYVDDLNQDGIPDLVVIHGGDPLKEPGSTKRAVGRILIVCGRTGQVLRWVEVPDKKESYYSPQILIHPDGTKLVLFGTGGETNGGSLWYISLFDLLAGRISKAKAIYSDPFKGIMTPPVLIDLNKDKVPDIVMAMFNSTVAAFDGLTFKKLWTSCFPSSESYSTPGVGFFNNDSVPDFIVNYQTGPGFPIYYYTQTTIIDGRNGEQLLSKPVRMVVGTQSSPLAISVEGFGNDIFLYWTSDCHGSRQNQDLEFEFLKGTSIHEQTRADFCKLRFKEKLFARLYAITRSMEPPGVVIYDSDAKKRIEFGNIVNYKAIGLSFLQQHPKYCTEYYQYAQGEAADSPEGRHFFDSNTPCTGRIPQVQKDLRQETVSQYSDEFGDDPLEARRMFGRRLGTQSSRGSVSHYPEYPPGRYRQDGYSMEQTPRLSDDEYDFDDRYDSLQSQYGDYATPQNWDGDLASEKLRDSKYWESGAKMWHPASRRRKMKQEAAAPWLHMNDYSRQAPAHQYPPVTRWNGRLDARRAIKHRTKRSGAHTKRHVGPHDSGGIQRIISTGTLAPVLGDSSSDDDNSIDVIFATFWFYPAQTQTLLPGDQKCIEEQLSKEAERFDVNNPTYGMDHDAYEEKVTEECLKKSGHFLDDANGTYVNIADYNPFNRPMGQMTVYRVRITCQCDKNKLSQGEQCPKVLPFEEQGWTSYMGLQGNALYNPRPQW